MPSVLWQRFPDDAWERRVALTWLGRLSFEVPADLLPGLPAEEKDFIMEAREWFDQKLKQEAERGEARERLRVMARVCAMRLGRPLTDAEHTVIAERLDRLGEDRVLEVAFSSSAETLAEWLTVSNVR